MLDALWIIASLFIATLIALYATWLLVHRLRRGEPKAKSFRQWLRDLCEAVLGLGVLSVERVGPRGSVYE